MMNRSHVRSIGWAMILTVCLGALAALTLRVNAVKSQVRLTERQILALRQDKDLLETEFQTRANQQQLSQINAVEFGYKAPTPGQYLEGERQLASLGKPRAADAPAPIMVASTDGTAGNRAQAIPAPNYPGMVSPLTGEAMAAELPKNRKPRSTAASDLSTRLSRVDGGPAPTKGAVRE